jgi:cell wall-associated NlpC family hydrolase
MTMTDDPRLTPARPDLAAQHLEGQVTAARFVAGETREIVEPVAPVRRAPSPDATLLTEALMGERVTVYETTDEGWAWGQLDADRYVGWLPAGALAAPGPEPNRKVAALRTLVFPGPDFRLPPIMGLPFGARLALMRNAPLYAATSRGFVFAQHLVPLDAVEEDFVAVAERFLGVPYLWGGKTSLGIDCSGLVQIALAACGTPCPRDSDMQEGTLGTAIAPDVAALRRGDLLFWQGHVAIVRDPVTLLHATAHYMAVVTEPLAPAVERICAGGSNPMRVKRM